MKTPESASDQARGLGLDSRRPAVRATAMQTIRAMGPHAIPFLLEVIEEQRPVRHRRRMVWLSLGLTAAYGTTHALFQFSSLESGPLIAFCVLWPLAVLFYGLYHQSSTQLRSQATTLLAEIADKEQVGNLILLLDSTEGEPHNLVRTALTRLLPDLESSDGEYLYVAHRKILAKKLKSILDHGEGENTAFLMALLQALKRVGDSSFIEPVHKLCYANAHTAGVSVRAQTAAMQCLPYLQAFAEQEAKSNTLVRAAAAPDRPAETLLRPAPGTPPAEAAVLVRSVDPEDAG